MADVRLSVAGVDPVAELESLAVWLSDEPDLRGLIGFAAAVPSPGELGAAADAVVAAVGAGGAVSVLAAALRAYLVQPRGSDVRIVAQGPDGRRVELDAQRVDDVEGLLRQVLGQGE
jgi:hypothetical protein